MSNVNRILSCELCLCTSVVSDIRLFSSPDVNECTDTGNRHKCDTMCINTVGGYNCSCADGYLLNDDMRTCRGEPNHYFTLSV